MRWLAIPLFGFVVVACGREANKDNASPAPPEPAPKVVAVQPADGALASKGSGLLVARGCKNGEVDGAGTGLAGTGSGCGTIGDLKNVDLATIGHGAGPRGVNGSRGENGTQVTLGEQHATAGLDPVIIKRIVRRHINELYYCYDKELVKAPKVDGTVQTKFAIELDGKVSDASATGMNADMQTCVVDVLQRIEFPRPTSKVDVTYPLAFKLNQ
jgi:hypothetical protein